MTVKTPPIEGQVYAIVENIDEYGAPHELTEDIDVATVITSKIAGTDRHKLIVDIDLPAQLIPSSTPGHFHLYVDKEIGSVPYFKLLAAFREAGLIEDGYFGASEERGFTAVRLPWVKKPEAAA